MTESAEPAARVKTRRRLPVWPFAAGLATVIVGVVVCALWLSHLAHDAEHQLTGARADVTLLRTDISEDNTPLALPVEHDLEGHSSAAYKDSRDVIWRIAAHIPDLGNDLKVAGGLADVANSLASKVLPPLVSASNGLRPDAIRGPDGSIDLTRVATVGSAVKGAIPAVAQAQQRLTGLQQRVHLNDLARARSDLATELSDVATSLHTVNQALSLLPPLLGADGPRHYFLVFQNLAEARGTGGLMGSYGVLTADHGALTLAQAGAGSDLDQSPDLKPAAVEPGGDFDSTWGLYEPVRDYFVANLSPHFPDAGQLFSQHADQQLKQHFDGVIAIDPLTLAALLGPDSVTLSDGTKVTGSNVAQVTESDLYTKYGEASPIRKALLVELAKDAFDEVRTAPGSRVLSALQSSIGAGRVQIWSAHPTEETQLAATDLGGVLPDKQGPFAWVAVNNTGAKTDFWLDRSLTYTTGACPAPKTADQSRDSEIDVTLTDRVPPGQNAIVSKDPDDPKAPYGLGHSYVSVYGPVGATFESATLNGKDIGATVSTERGHLVASFDVLEPDGAPQRFAVQFSEPAAGVASVWRPQPLAQPEVVDESRVFACRP